MKRHSTKSADHYTPGDIVEAARGVLGRIDLDPASSLAANDIVQAKQIYTREDNGLVQSWYGNVFLNPPGNCKDDSGQLTACAAEDKKICTCGLVKKFWRNLLHHYNSGDVKHAIWIGFSCSQLQTLQPGSPLRYPTCFPSYRLRYLTSDPDSILGGLKVGASPPQNSYITYLGDNVQAFRKHFSPFGEIVTAL